MSSCHACNQTATHCAYSDQGHLAPCCSRCARTVTVWGSASAFLQEVNYASRKELGYELDRLHRKHRSSVKRARELLAARDYGAWKLHVDGAGDRLYARAKAAIDAHDAHASKQAVLTRLPLAAVRETPRMVDVAARECPIAEAQDAEQSAGGRVHAAGLALGAIEYDDGRTLAISSDDHLLVLNDGTRTLYGTGGCYTTSGPVAAADVCAAMALLRSEGYDEVDSYYFHIGIRQNPASVALWNYTLRRLLRIALPTMDAFSLATISLASSPRATLYLQTMREDGQRRFWSVPSALAYEI